MKYKGEKCFFCNEEFQDNDDVVVCPECGTPYHRHCYEEAGSCINHSLHESGESWKGEHSADDEVKTDDKQDIQSTLNDTDSALNQSEAEFSGGSENEFIRFDLNKPFFGLDPNEDFEGVRMSELFAFVKTNTMYYIPLFKKMKSMGSKISFNLTSFFFPYFYFANRKMWFMALISVFVMLILQIPAVLINLSDSISYGFFDESMIHYVKNVLSNLLSFIENNYNTIETFAWACNLIGYAFRIAMCLFGNWLYYRFTIKSVNKIKLRCPDSSRSMSIISNSGGTSTLNIFLIALVMFGGYFVISILIDMLSVLM